jgi:hypothetical protein
MDVKKDSNDETALRERLWQASNLADVLACLEGLRRLEQLNGIETEPSLSIREDIYAAFRELPADDLGAVTTAVVNDLLPNCVQSGEDPRTDQAYAARRYQDILATWLAELSEDSRQRTRSIILASLAEYLGGDTAAGACWTIAKIGFRERVIVSRLWGVIETSSDLVGDIALACLIALGVPEDARPRIVTALIQRARARRNVPLLNALRLMADPATLGVVAQNWFVSDSEDRESDFSSHAVRILVDITDAHSENLVLQDAIWGTLEGLFDKLPQLDVALFLGSDVVPRCNSPYGVQYLVSRMDPVGTRSNGSRQRELACIRLAECVRPRQVEGWALGAQPAVRDRLYGDVQLDTDYGGRDQTEDGSIKQASWATLLLLGDRSLPSAETFEACIARETSPYIRGHLCDDLSCFRIEPLPSTAERWVTEDHNMSYLDAGASLSWRLGTSAIVAAVPSRASFATLLNFGFRYDGHVMQRLVDLLGAQAAELLRNGDTSVPSLLLQAAGPHSPGWRRAAALGALEDLALEEDLPPGFVDQLAELLDDGTLDGYSRQVLIRTIGVMGVSPANATLTARLRQEAEESIDQDVRWAALGALGRLQALVEDSRLMANALGLKLEGRTWTVGPQTEMPDGWVRTVGILYSQHPTKWAQPISQAIRRGGWVQAERAARVVFFVHSRVGAKSVPRSVRAALIARTVTEDPFRGRSSEMVYVSARMAPGALASSRARKEWSTWDNSSVIRLAESFGAADEISERDNESMVNWLVDISTSSTYSVRRAAYRALARKATQAFEIEQSKWTRSMSAFDRQRAAEAGAWMPDPDWKALKADEEPSVRAAVERSRADRRDREWADLYVERLREVDPGSNAAILAAWPYAEALKRIGDESTSQQLEVLVNLGNALNTRSWLRQILADVDKRVEGLLKERNQDVH